MERSPLISIVTIVKNGENYLDQTITSVLAQTYPNIEYIVIDGGSSDGTIDIIKKYEEKIAYWLSEPDNGISEAFNKGIKVASGELIGIVNSDDWFEDGAIKNVVEIYKNNKCDVICFAVKFWEKNKKILLSHPDIESITRETSIHHSGVFIKKSVYEKLGLYDTSYNYAMDYELLLRFKMCGVKFCSANLLVSNRRLEGISYKNRTLALKEVRRARSKYFSKSNVFFNYWFIWIKDLIGRLLKVSFMKSIYLHYWNNKNYNLSKGESS
jgi:glycosyltransferase involved in cell wall biosynthesis